MQRTVLYQHRHDRAAALVKARLNDRALGSAVGIGAKLQHFRLQDKIFKQVVDAGAGLGGDRADDRVAAPLLTDDVILGQLLLDAVGVGTDLIHLVDRNDDRDTRRLCVVDALNGLRHDAVVRRDHKDRDVGHHCAAGAHRGKGLVARGIEEGDRAAVDLDGIGADVLRDAAGLTGGDVGVADIVKQRGLAVVDVSHDDDDRRTGNEFFFAVGVIVDQLLLDRDDNFLFDLAAKLHRDQRRGVIVDHVGNRGEHAQLEQLLDDLCRRLLHAGGQLAHGDLVGDLYLELLLFRDLKLQALHLVALLLAALGRGGLRVLTLLVLVADLFLLAASAAALKVVSAAGAGEIFKLFVILLDVDRSAASRIDLVSTTRFSATWRGTCGLSFFSAFGVSVTGAFVCGAAAAFFTGAAASFAGAADSAFFSSCFGAAFGSTLKISSRLSTWLCWVIYSKITSSSFVSSTCI